MDYYYSINENTQRWLLQTSRGGTFEILGRMAARDYYFKHCADENISSLMVSLYRCKDCPLAAVIKVNIFMEPRFSGEVILDSEYEREKSRKIVDFKDSDIVRVQTTLGGKEIDCKCKAKVKQYSGPTFTIMEDCDGFKAGHTFLGSTRDVVEVVEGVYKR